MTVFSPVKNGMMLAGAIWYWPGIMKIGPDDIKLIKDHGYTHLKIDFWWNSLEPVEGRLETGELLEAMDLAQSEGVPVILNLFGAPEPAAPHWAYEKFRDAWFTDQFGHGCAPCDGNLCIAGTGAYPGLCWDSAEVRASAESFIIRLIDTFKDHKALAAWNIWAEPLTEPARGFGPDRRFCYCRHTLAAYREWLKRKYETIEGINKAWGTTFTEWRHISPPMQPKRHHTPWMAWKTFLADRIAANLAWKSAIFKSRDPIHPISAYPMAFSGNDPVSFDMDDWKMQEPLDTYGVSFYQAFHFPGADVNLPGWMNHFDGIRSACERTKQGQYILGENQVSQVYETIQTPGWQLRLSRITALACGASSVWDWCLRLPYPGSWWSTFGLARPDGTPGPWADEIKHANSIMRRISEYWDKPRVNSRIAILYDPRTYYSGEVYGKVELVRSSQQGFYKLAWDSGATVDFVHAGFLTLQGLTKYKTVFIPYMPTVSSETARILSDYVTQGGTVVAEAGFGYQDDEGWAVSRIPHEMQDVFGCRTLGIFEEKDPEIRIGGEGKHVLHGVRFREYYRPTTGQVIGSHLDGSAGLVRSNYGKGTAMLIGTLVGSAYDKSRDPHLRKFLGEFMCSELSVCNIQAPGYFSARLVHCRENDILFLINCSSEAENPGIRFTDANKRYTSGTDIETGDTFGFNEHMLSVDILPREARTLLLK